MDLSRIAQISTAIRTGIQSVIIGKTDNIDLILTAIFAGGHVLLEDVPGTGKTMLAKTLARCVDGRFSRIQFTPDLLPSDVTGINFYDRGQNAFVFREGPVFTNILLADEINRATPRTQSSLLEAMEEKQTTVDGVTRPLPDPFFVIATQNPVETAGTFPLPEAQLDRFIMKLTMGLPDHASEMTILENFMNRNPLAEVSPVCSVSDLTEICAEVRRVYVHPALREYMLAIVEATRQSPSIVLGVSPRGSLALMRASQAYAAIAGREYVIPEDVQVLAAPVLSHRLLLAHSMSASTQNLKDVIADILTGITVPTEEWKK